MSAIWTASSRRLERLLIDADVHPDTVELLRRVGYRVTEARNVPEIDVTRDTSVVAWARRNKHVVVCHDQHRDRATNQYLYPEVYKRGGRVLRIGGDNSQDPMLALGKVLVHRASWRAFFDEEGNGIVVVHASKFVSYNARRLLLFLQKEMPLALDPEKTTRARIPRSRRRRTKPPRASRPLID